MRWTRVGIVPIVPPSVRGQARSADSWDMRCRPERLLVVLVLAPLAACPATVIEVPGPLPDASRAGAPPEEGAEADDAAPNPAEPPESAPEDPPTGEPAPSDPPSPGDPPPGEEAPPVDPPPPSDSPPLWPPDDEGTPPAAPPPPVAPPPGASGHGALTPDSLFMAAVEVDGVERHVRMVVPPQLDSGPLPLVLLFHDNGQAVDELVQGLGLGALSHERGFILAAPQGVDRVLEGIVATPLAWDAYRALPDNEDLRLFDELLAALVATGSVRTDEVHVLGYSQGGFMAFRVAMDRADRLASAAVVAAASPLGDALVTSAARPIPVVLRIGQGDALLEVARASRAALANAGHELAYEELAGVGHAPFPGEVAPLVEFLLTHSL